MRADLVLHLQPPFSSSKSTTSDPTSDNSHITTMQPKLLLEPHHWILTQGLPPIVRSNPPPSRDFDSLNHTYPILPSPTAQDNYLTTLREECYRARSI